MLLRMTHPLDGSRAKIARAADHLETLDAALSRFVRDGGFRMSSEPDPDTGEHVMRVYSQLQPPVPPSDATSVMVGDALHNLRSALDHLIWRLAKTPTRANQFPIFDAPEAFKKESKRYLRSVPKTHGAKIEAYQPYPGRSTALSTLAKLNDVDKHRLLLPGATSFAGLTGRFSGYGVNSLTVTGHDWTPFEDGAEVYRLAIEPSGGPMNVKAEVSYTVVFRDPDSSIGVSIQDLRTIRLSVSNIVESFAGDF